jgi:adenosylcobinamide-GDP ribazoletransferase
MVNLSYVRMDGKAKPIATSLGNGDAAIATVFGLMPIPLTYMNFSPFILNLNDWLLLGGYCLVPVVLVWLWWRNKIKHWLGGYTGDCLGAMQQITELAFYFGLLAWYRQL